VLCQWLRTHLRFHSPLFLTPCHQPTINNHQSDVGFTIIFGIEAVLKILAFNFRVYISTATNKVDLLIVITSALLLALDSAQLEAVKVRA